MKYHGVVYDVGLRFTAGQPLSVDTFDPELVKSDIRAIKDELFASAIRIEGEEIDRLVVAAREASAVGLTVFFNPWKMNVEIAELPGYFAVAARAAEELRLEGVEIVFVAGCEMTLFNEGIFRGATITERIEGIIALSEAVKAGDVATTEAIARSLNEALKAITVAVRSEFKGQVTYSAGMWEQVDWDLFDIVGIDHYRSTETAKEYVSTLDRYKIGKPVVVMEVGCCAYEGAAKYGAGGFMLLEGTNPDGTGRFKDGVVPKRSEREQADYVDEQLALLKGSKVSGVFVYVFSFPTYPYGEGLRDLDMMSFSLVKTYPENHADGGSQRPWKPKEAFYRIAAIYKDLSGK
ncbi:hypothetical protein N5F23_01480 [Pseudomonas sichuanensis]|uniref:hypothetical protein n=1 Tax=Pseudomonas sichuanensis TaxID=2213015 RepID=UPI00244BB22D|nr:hypothetical protein [Pseudomonas sichuanensis]MDH0730150.1 hypothetical protein [Pseudomonas sichuanensis]MDH1581266.1 hypothetical protein [Pseudomonas sichuanensis]MDH1593427.1 hypothetical protein [Pseudomonas sichuanensis]MDH1597182.1 hypothetical protein [Pseudomonas sichuanensis]